MADPATFAQAAAICQRRLDKLQQNTSLSAQVRRIMLEKAKRLSVAERDRPPVSHDATHLHRRLQDEGTSYKDILENVRHMLALEHLKAGHPIQEIAYTLGYTDLANFRRAFKRWEGVAPRPTPI